MCVQVDTIRVVELFAGVGGFRLGLEQASPRYQTVWANQWEPSTDRQDAYACYCSHWGPHAHCICADIRKVSGSIPPHDLLVGGFPCQDYSIANKKGRGLEGPKGALWWQINHIIHRLRPRCVLLENVDRLVRSPDKQRGRDFSVMLRCLYGAGYAVEWRIINAADHGCAQRRKRIFLFAFRNDTAAFLRLAEEACIHGLKGFHRWVMQKGLFATAFPARFHSKSFSEGWLDEMSYSQISDVFASHQERYYSAGTMINGRYYTVDVDPIRQTSIPLRNILEQTPVQHRYFLRPEDLPTWKYLKGAKNEFKRGKDGQYYRFSEGAMPFPDHLDRPSRTIITREGKLERGTHVVQDIRTGRLRILTPMECERLNGFPDHWTATGMSEERRYFTMGNALVVPIVQRLGVCMLPWFEA